MALKAFPKPTYEQLEAELAALRIERANHLADVRRVVAWIENPQRKRAVNAFTEGPERQLAYRFESLLRGEHICTKCGLRQDAVSDGSPRPDF